MRCCVQHKRFKYEVQRLCLWCAPPPQAGAMTGFVAAFTEGPIDFFKSQIQVQILRSKTNPDYKRECRAVTRCWKGGARAPCSCAATCCQSQPCAPPPHASSPSHCPFSSLCMGSPPCCAVLHASSTRTMLPPNGASAHPVIFQADCACMACIHLHRLRQTHPAPHTLRQTHPAPHVCMLCVLHACIQVLYSKHILQGLSPLFTGQPAILSAFFPCAARLPAAPYTTVSECVRSAVRANGFRGPFQVSMRALCAGQGWCSACVDDGHFQAHARASSAGQGSSGIRWGGHPF